MNTTFEDKNRLTAGFLPWCQKLAKALDGALEPKPADSINEGWQTLRLTDGFRVSLHLNAYDAKVSVSGNWPKDHTGSVVTPRDFLRHGEHSINIHVSATREPEAVAKDIKRRFLPAFTEQYAGCLARVSDRAAFASKTERNTARLAAAVGCARPDKRQGSESYLYPELPGIYRINVSGDSVTFEARSLPVDQAEQVLRLLATFKNSAAA